MPVVHAPVVHRHGKEAGGAKRLVAGPQLLEVTPERFAPLVDAKDHLSKWPSACQWRCKHGLRRQRVEHLDAVTPLVREVEQPTPGDVVKACNGLFETDKLVLVESTNVTGGDPHELRHLVEQERPRQTAGAALCGIAVAELCPQAGQPAAALCSVAVLEVPPFKPELQCRPFSGHAVADQSQRQEIDELRRHGLHRSPVGPLFQVMDHPRPSTEGEQGFHDEFLPVLLGNAESIEFRCDHINRRESTNVSQSTRQPGAPRLRGTKAAGIHSRGRYQQPMFAAGHRPGRDSLIEKGGADSNQQRMDEHIRIEVRVDRTNEITMPDGWHHVDHRGAGERHRLHAGMPQFARRPTFAGNAWISGKRCLPSGFVVGIGKWAFRLSGAAHAIVAH